MSTLSQFAGSGPIAVTTYTVGAPGTGTHVCNSATVRARITLVGGGGGGSGFNSSTATPGAAGASLHALVRVSGSVAYSVGAAGTGGAAGGASAPKAGGTTSFGTWFAPGGGANQNTVANGGGMVPSSSG